MNWATFAVSSRVRRGITVADEVDGSSVTSHIPHGTVVFRIFSETGCLDDKLSGGAVGPAPDEHPAITIQTMAVRVRRYRIDIRTTLGPECPL
jgi:hypothetical protein